MRVTFHIFSIISFIKTIIQRINEGTFSLFFEKLFNNDFIFESVNFIEIIVLNIKSSTLQERKRR